MRDLWWYGMRHLPMHRLRRFGSERGATAVEYAVMVALIAVVIVIAVLVLGTTVSSTFSQTDECVRVRTTPTCPP